MRDLHDRQEYTQRLVEWNKETKRLMDLEIYGGGGGIEPIHPECAYPDEKYINDNEIYFIIGLPSTNTAFKINRFEMVNGGNGINCEIGYINEQRKFINQTMEWGYGNTPILHYSGETYKEENAYYSYRDEYIYAMSPIIELGTAVNDLKRDSIVIKIYPASLHASIYNIILCYNSNMFDGTALPLISNNANIVGIYGKCSGLRYANIGKCDTLIYFNMIDNCCQVQPHREYNYQLEDTYDQKSKTVNF